MTHRRPTTRAECPTGPCPYVGCKYHLWHDAKRPGRNRLGATPDDDLDPLTLHTACTLAFVADHPSGATLAEVGEAFNASRETIRLLEATALDKLRVAIEADPELADVFVELMGRPAEAEAEEPTDGLPSEEDMEMFQGLSRVQIDIAFAARTLTARGLAPTIARVAEALDVPPSRITQSLGHCRTPSLLRRQGNKVIVALPDHAFGVPSPEDAARVWGLSGPLVEALRYLVRGVDDPSELRHARYFLDVAIGQEAA